MKRAVVLVLDSFGIGAAADAERFGDAGSNTLGHIAAHRARAGNPLKIPNLARLGLLHAARESCGAVSGRRRDPMSRSSVRTATPKN